MPELYPRHQTQRILLALGDTPVVLINGPRQCGKTTLARQTLPQVPYYSLDDDTLLSSVRLDPQGFVQRLDCAIIDEVQRAPELLRAIKLAVDQDRRAGRFLLTGSANLLALPQISDSLAGRMEVITLLPLSQAELNRTPSRFIEYAQTQSWPTAAPSPCVADARTARVLSGGYPEMLSRPDPTRRLAWANAYLKAVLQRDLRDIAEIEKLQAVPSLLKLLAHMSGQLCNFTQIGAQLGLDSKTAQKYVGLLEHIFLVKRVPSWGRNELGRLIKSHKIHFIDAGLQASLTKMTPTRALVDRTRFGPTMETWVFGELQKNLNCQAPDGSSHDGWDIYHFRDAKQNEVDFVLENEAQQILGIEVKASASVNSGDFKGLRRLQDLAGRSFLSGLVLYDGENALPFGPDLWAIPLSFL